MLCVLDFRALGSCTEHNTMVTIKKYQRTPYNTKMNEHTRAHTHVTYGIKEHFANFPIKDGHKALWYDKRATE